MRPLNMSAGAAVDGLHLGLVAGGAIILISRCASGDWRSRPARGASYTRRLAILVPCVWPPTGVELCGLRGCSGSRRAAEWRRLRLCVGAASLARLLELVPRYCALLLVGAISRLVIYVWLRRLLARHVALIAVAARAEAGVALAPASADLARRRSLQPAPADSTGARLPTADWRCSVRQPCGRSRRNWLQCARRGSCVLASRLRCASACATASPVGAKREARRFEWSSAPAEVSLIDGVRARQSWRRARPTERPRPQRRRPLAAPALID